MTTYDEHELLECFRTALRQPQLCSHDNIFLRGVNSILIVRAISLAAERGISVPITIVYQQRSVDNILRALRDEGTRDDSIFTSIFPLTPTGQFLMEPGRFGEHYNICNLWKYDRTSLDLERLASIANSVATAIPSLSTRLCRVDEKVLMHRVDGVAAVSLELIDFKQLKGAEYSNAIERFVAGVQRSIQFELDQPVVRMYAIEGADGQGRLFVVSHHLYLDGLGFRILLREISRAYEADKNNSTFVSAAAKSDAEVWVARLTKYANGEATAELPYWLSLPWETYKEFKFPAEYRTSDVRVSRISDAAARRLHHQAGDLDAAELDELYRDQCFKRRHLARDASLKFCGLEASKQIDIVLLAVARVIAHITGFRELLIDVFDAVRTPIFEDCDVTRVVGYVNEIVPLPVEITAEESLKGALDSIFEQRMRPPKRGIGLRAMRYLNSDDSIASTLTCLPEPKLAVNFVASLQQDYPRTLINLPLAEEWSGPTMDEAQTPYSLSFSISVKDGVVVIDTRHDPRELNFAACDRANKEVALELQNICAGLSCV